MAERRIYTLEYLSEIFIEDIEAPIREQFLLNGMDDDTIRVNENANYVHLENFEKANKKFPNKLIGHSLKLINKSKVSTNDYQFTKL